ncbi:hypothetical protein POTOM_055515 [Populus tomentosa]|uniref:S1 motif domain-containing protein n=1 Tax=Populus tomentosa TaxID=118781 RepID=A0A8X7YB92_POPTO|nr:hypothetical protein POTOM_055515 [Populus tomentosa]
MGWDRFQGFGFLFYDSDSPNLLGIFISRGNWEIPTRELHAPPFIPMFTTDREYLDSDFEEEYPLPSSRSVMCCRIVAIIIKDLNEPIEIKISEWNTGGLLARIEGLRAFLPKAELMNRVNNFKELKENVKCNTLEFLVGRQIYMLIKRINESNNELILSEREAWEMINLREGTLLEGTVKKLFPYGAQVRIGETNRSGLLHVSNITRARISSVSDLLIVDEKVKVLVAKSMFPDKISLSFCVVIYQAGALPAPSSEPSTPASIGSQEVQRPPRNAASPSSQQRSNGISGVAELASGLGISKDIDGSMNGVGKSKRDADASNWMALVIGWLKAEKGQKDLKLGKQIRREKGPEITEVKGKRKGSRVRITRQQVEVLARFGWHVRTQTASNAYDETR